MNNFLDLLDIDHTLDIMLHLEPVGSPRVCVTVNLEKIWQGTLTNSTVLMHQLPLMSHCQIVVELIDKDYAVDSTSAVVVTQLKIDDFEIVPNWTQMVNYCNDRNYCDPTNYLGYNGQWKLDINQPFYHWHHDVTGQGWLLRPSANHQDLT